MNRNRRLIYLLIGPAALFVAAMAGRMALVKSPIDVRDGTSCYGLPATARHIDASGSYASFNAEFEITEAELRDEAQRRGWLLQEIVEPVTASRLFADVDPARPDAELRVTQGLFFNNLSHRGGYSVTFDRLTGRAYWVYGGW